MANKKQNWGSHQSLDQSFTSVSGTGDTRPDYRPERGPTEPYSNSYSLHVTNIPMNTNLYTFMGYFSDYGNLLGVNLYPRRKNDAFRSGFITYDSFGAAEKAIMTLDQAPPLNLNVDFSRKDKERMAKRCGENSNGHGNGDERDFGNPGPKMEISFMPGCDGRQITVYGEDSLCCPINVTDRSEYRLSQKDGAAGRNYSQNRPRRDNNGFQRREYNFNDKMQDRRGADGRQQRSEDSMEFNNAGRQRNDNRNFHGHNEGSNADGPRNFRQNDGGRSRPNKERDGEDFNKMRQRARSCDNRDLNSRSRHKRESEDSDVSDAKPDVMKSEELDLINHERMNEMRGKISVNSDNQKSASSSAKTHNTSSSDHSLLNRELEDDSKLPLDTSERCTITHVENGFFWIQRNSEFADKLAIELNNDAKKTQRKDYNLRMNGVYLVQFDMDSMWYRGRIVKYNDDGTYNVIFIDYGNSSKNVSKQNILGLSPEKYKFPPQAIKCKPSKLTTTKYSSFKAFAEAISGASECFVKAESFNDDFYVATVDIKRDKEPKPVASAAPKLETNEKEVQPETSLSDMLLSLKKTKTECREEKSELFIPLAHSTPPSSTSSTSSKLPPKDSPSQSPTIEQSEITRRNEEIEETSVEQSRNEKLTIQSETSPASVKQEKEIHESSPFKLAKKLSEKRANPQLAATNNNDFQFGSSIISQLNVGDKFIMGITVLDGKTSFWGFGDTGSFMDSIGTIDPKYEETAQVPVSIPAVGTLVAGKSAAYGNWGRVIALVNGTLGTEVFFIDYGNKEVVTMMKPILDVDASIPALAIYGKIDVSAIEEKGVKDNLVVNAIFNLRVIKKEDTEHVVAEIVELNNTRCCLSSGKAKFSEELFKREEKKVDKQSPLITMEILPKLELGQEKEVLCYCVKSYNCIFVVPKNYDEALQSIMGCDPPQIVGESYIPLVKELILAKYKEDSKWYRAEIKKIEQDQAHVLFIDFGNEDDVNFSDIRPIPSKLLQTPSFIVSLARDPGSLEPLEKFLGESIAMNVIDDSVSPIIVEFQNNQITLFP